MQKLYDKIKHFTIEDAIKTEESDRQYIALKNLYENILDKDLYLPLIISNSIICYQLSWKWEDYWEEFSEYFSNLSPLGGKYPKGDRGIIEKLWNFIKNSKNNKRFVDTKIKRLEKLRLFIEKYIDNQEYYYENMLVLRDELAKTMKQKIDAKTIVFAVKMFWYGARNYFDKLNYYPEELTIPIDSRLEKMFEKYNISHEKENEFYLELSKKLKIPELHLDALVWVNYDELIKDS